MNIQAFCEQDDWPHEAGNDPLWQESSLFVWNDLEQGVGGSWRIGQEPNAGATNSCFGVFTATGLRFRSNVSGAALRPAERGEAHMAWGPHLKVEFDRGACLSVNFPDCEANLHFADFHPRFDYHAIAMPGRPLSGAAHRFEVSGRMTGTIRIGAEEIAVNALGCGFRRCRPPIPI